MTKNKQNLIIFLGAIFSIVLFLSLVRTNQVLASCGGCGNGACEPECGENSSNCPFDCGSSCGGCGNGVCEPECGENASNCPFDCGPSCQDECSYSGQTQKRCSGNYVQERTCGNYDSDPCLEWSAWQDYQNCNNLDGCYGTTYRDYYCSGGSCKYHSYPNDSRCVTCTNECSYSGQRRCYGSQSYQICGNYDSDPCLEWSSPIYCSYGQVCQNGSCVSSCTSHHHEACYDNDVYWYDSCGNREEKAKECGESGWTNDYRCSGTFVQRKWINRGCSNAQCYENEEWKNVKDCYSEGKICQNGQCVAKPNNPPVADAGPDKEVLEGESVVLEGSGYDPDGDLITFDWHCTGGNLYGSHSPHPTFTAPNVSQDTLFLCVLTVIDSRGFSSSDSMKVLVKNKTLSVTLEAIPSSGHAPLYDVDLKATVSGTASGLINYKFDCTGDGTFEYVFSGTSENPKIVQDACDYVNGGTYNAKVFVERGGETAWAQATITVSSPYPVVDLKVNGSDGPITIAYNTSATLSWTSKNVNSCYASGDWSGSKPTSGSQSTGKLTSSKTYTITCSGAGGSVSDSVVVYVSQPPVEIYFSVAKEGKNLSKGASWTDNVFAEPKDVIEIRIEIKAGDKKLENVFVKDDLPEKMTFMKGTLKVDGVKKEGNIENGINIGDIDAHQKKVVTFEAYLAGPDQFTFGTTKLVNKAIVTANGKTVSDTATINVRKTGVLAASTGIEPKTIFKFLALPFVGATLSLLVFKPYLIEFEDWLKVMHRGYREKIAKKLLEIKIEKMKRKGI